MHEKPLWTRTSMRSGRCGGGLAVGETQNKPFQLSFNPSLRVNFQGSRVTSDGGLLLVRELDERLGLSLLWPSTSQTTGVDRTRQTVGSAPDENRSTVCDRARRVYYGAVFEIKKEIAITMMPEGWLSILTFSGGIS